MKRFVHALPSATPGTTHELTSLHFGQSSATRKVYIQAALHADETPSMLVAAVLRQRLEALEVEGALDCQVVLVPIANPVGLGQHVLGNFIGRFDLASGQNFNRSFPVLHEKIAAAIDGRLDGDPRHNLCTIRRAWRDALMAREPKTEFDALQRTLMLLAHDGDVVLDLHCSREAAMHVYTGESIWKEAEPLARYLGAKASLLAIDSGAASFDEAHSTTWWQLQQTFGQRFPIPSGSIAVTVEHRGQRDVSQELAEQDAAAILHYLVHVGAIRGTAPPLPELPYPATPLAGSEQLVASAAGILVYRARMGDPVEVGQPLFDIVDPVSAQRTTIVSRTAGVFYMGRDVRFVKLGDPLGRVSGAKVMRTGNLLSA